MDRELPPGKCHARGAGTVGSVRLRDRMVEIATPRLTLCRARASDVVGVQGFRAQEMDDGLPGRSSTQRVTAWW